MMIFQLASSSAHYFCSENVALMKWNGNFKLPFLPNLAMLFDKRLIVRLLLYYSSSRRHLRRCRCCRYHRCRLLRYRCHLCRLGLSFSSRLQESTRSPDQVVPGMCFTSNSCRLVACHVVVGSTSIFPQSYLSSLPFQK